MATRAPEAASDVTRLDVGQPRRARPVRTGVVSAARRQKTITVRISFSVRHPKYGKFVRRKTVLHAHDENGEAREGDVVEIVECRPMSRTKRFRLVRVVQRAAAPPEQAAPAGAGLAE